MRLRKSRFVDYEPPGLDYLESVKAFLVGEGVIDPFSLFAVFDQTGVLQLLYVV